MLQSSDGSSLPDDVPLSVHSDPTMNHSIASASNNRQSADDQPIDPVGILDDESIEPSVRSEPISSLTINFPIPEPSGSSGYSGPRVDLEGGNGSSYL